LHEVPIALTKYLRKGREHHARLQPKECGSRTIGEHKHAGTGERNRETQDLHGDLEKNEGKMGPSPSTLWKLPSSSGHDGKGNVLSKKGLFRERPIDQITSSP